jgi:hypothetical protein
MSMDDLYVELQSFITALNRFNEAMAKNWDELQRTWDYADELWGDDSTRREFESQWREMGAALRIYREEHGEKYEEFLLQRKWALDEYFGRR